MNCITAVAINRNKMSKQAEEFFRQENIKQAKNERMEKFFALVNYEKEAEIMQKYADEQLRLYVVNQQRELLSQYNSFVNMQYNGVSLDDADIDDFMDWLNCG